MIHSGAHAFACSSDFADSPTTGILVLQDVKLPCGHLMCSDCSEQIMKRNPQCPFCRAEAKASVKIQIAGSALLPYAEKLWCAAGLEKNQVRSMLWTMRPGSFFVRESSSARNTYALDVAKPGGGIHSFRINYKDARWVFALQPLNPPPQDQDGAMGYATLEDCLEQFPHPTYRLLYPGGKVVCAIAPTEPLPDYCVPSPSAGHLQRMQSQMF